MKEVVGREKIKHNERGGWGKEIKKRGKLTNRRVTKN